MSGRKRFEIIIILCLIIIAAVCAFFFIFQEMFSQKTVTAVSGMSYDSDAVRPVMKKIATVTAGESVDASFFVDRYDSELTPYYADYPDFFKLGLQTVSIKYLGESELFSSSLLVVKPKDFISMEAQNGIPDLQPEDFLVNLAEELNGAEVSFVSDIYNIDFSTVSENIVKIKVNELVVSSSLMVIDTTPPTAEAVSVHIFSNETVSADAFVDNVFDFSDVSVLFIAEPDFGLYGEQNVSVILKDAFGNETFVQSVLTIELDDEPPVISGVIDISIFIGNTISYRKGVTVTDDKDPSPELTIDSAGVNKNIAGTYTVTYTATDKAKNSTSVTATVTVNPVKEEDVFQMVDDILAKITTPSMTQLEVARKIFNWVTNSISYTSSSDKSNVISGAYLGLINRFGDCYTYYAVSELLLDRAGIENVPVTRVGGKSRHYWSLINIGTGWHHFDSCRKSIPWDSFMMTDNSAEAYTKIAGNDYYTYDKQLYPEVVLGENVTYYRPPVRTETPVQETPVEEVPTDEAPTDEVPSNETPTEDAPSDETPAQETPAAETPEQETPTAETPAQETPAAETPAQETPAAETPEQETPTQEAPADETPAQEVPVILDPTEEVPAVVILPLEQPESPQP